MKQANNMCIIIAALAHDDLFANCDFGEKKKIEQYYVHSTSFSAELVKII